MAKHPTRKVRGLDSTSADVHVWDDAILGRQVVGVLVSNRADDPNWPDIATASLSPAGARRLAAALQAAADAVEAG